MNTLPQVCVVGKVNLDFVFNVSRFPEHHEKMRCDKCAVQAGGSATNTAAWLKCLGHPVLFVGALAADPPGRLARELLSKAGIQADLVVDDELAETGVACVLSGPSDKRMIIAGSTARLPLERLATLRVGECRHIHYASLTSSEVDSVHQMTAHLNASYSCDLNGQWRSDAPRRCDVLFSNADELPTTGREALERPECLGACCVVLTQGTAGATYHRGLERVHSATRVVETVDGTGSGDAFDAGFLSGWLADPDEPRQALVLGLACAAVARTVRGGFPPEGAIESVRSMVDVLETAIAEEA